MEEMPVPYRKKRIPRALREAVWIHHCGRSFEQRCKTPWCKNNITVFDFQTGHNIPESKGGATTIDNLVPLCSRCNLSMGNQYTFQEWSTQFSPTPNSWWKRLFGCAIAKIKPLAKTPRHYKLPLPISSTPLQAPLGKPQSDADSSSMSS